MKTRTNSSYPYPTRTVFQQGSHLIALQSARGAGFLLERAHFVAIETHQSRPGAEPENPLAILRDTVYCAVHEPHFGG